MENHIRVAWDDRCNILAIFLHCPALRITEYSLLLRLARTYIWKPKKNDQNAKIWKKAVDRGDVSPALHSHSHLRGIPGGYDHVLSSDLDLPGEKWG